MAESVSVVRVAAVGDLHCSKNSQGLIRPLFENSDKFADVLVLCGDLTDCGLPDEAHLLVEELSVASKLPIVAARDGDGSVRRRKRLIGHDGWMRVAQPAHVLAGDEIFLRARDGAYKLNNYRLTPVGS